MDSHGNGRWRQNKQTKLTRRRGDAEMNGNESPALNNHRGTETQKRTGNRKFNRKDRKEGLISFSRFSSAPDSGLEENQDRDNKPLVFELPLTQPALGLKKNIGAFYPG